MVNEVSLNTSEVTIGTKKYTSIPGYNLYSDENGMLYTMNRSMMIPADASYFNAQVITEDVGGIQDNGYSNAIISQANKFQYTEYDYDSNTFVGSDLDVALRHLTRLYGSDELRLDRKYYRFGYYNLDTHTNLKEFLFFTKPDLHIINEDSGRLTRGIRTMPFFQKLVDDKPYLVNNLEISLNESEPFNWLLSNQCISTLEVPLLNSETVDTAQNMYGFGYSYLGSSEASDDKPTFSLEFKETRWLDIFDYFKAYNVYETIKHHGIIRPHKEHIYNREVHDLFAIYKFMVADDMETIVYYGKMWGVMPKSLPRDVYGQTQFDNGISYTIEFEAACYDDMDPLIWQEFNALGKAQYDSLPYKIDVYNEILDAVDTRPVMAAQVEKVKSVKAPGGYVLKLRWRGDDQI